MYTLILTILLWGSATSINVTHGWSQHDCQVAAQTWLAANKGENTHVTALCVPGGPDGETRITR